MTLPEALATLLCLAALPLVAWWGRQAQGLEGPVTVTLPARGHVTHDAGMQCSVDGCILRYRALGLCEVHYRQQLRRERAEAAWEPPPVRRRVVVGGIVRWEVS